MIQLALELTDLLLRSHSLLHASQSVHVLEQLVEQFPENGSRKVSTSSSWSRQMIDCGIGWGCLEEKRLEACNGGYHGAGKCDAVADGLISDFSQPFRNDSNQFILIVLEIMIRTSNFCLIRLCIATGFN